ncbi:MAG TPA: hypothetical protein PK830_03265 [Candidatus Atribacteria bacterium]|nr:hypothetical protein [Candidatus Atribacteria bacterium]
MFTALRRRSAVIAVAIIIMVSFAASFVPASASDIKTTPVVRVQVNGGDWLLSGDLRELGNPGNDWIGVPIDLALLKTGLNTFYVDTNVDNGAVKLVCSALRNVAEGERGTSWFTDNGGASWYDISDQKVVNVILRLWKNDNWVNINSAYDEGQAGVLGLGTIGSNVYGAGRSLNVSASDLEGAESAELLVNVHIPDGVDSLQLDPKAGQTAPILVSTVNGKKKYTDLTSKMGSVNTWVYVPVSISTLRTGINEITIDSNVTSTDYFPNQLKILLSPRQNANDSFVSDDNMNSWMDYTDKIVNICLELYDGSKWVAVPSGEDYSYIYDIAVVIGKYMNNTTWAFKRLITIDSLTGYTDARLAVNVNVGSRLEAAELPPLVEDEDDDENQNEPGNQDEEENPHTGDQISYIIYFGLAAIALIGLAAALASKRTNKARI